MVFKQFERKSREEMFKAFNESKSPSKKQDLRPKKKLLLFPELRVTRKICTRAAPNLFFIIGFPEIFSFLH